VTVGTLVVEDCTATFTTHRNALKS